MGFLPPSGRRRAFPESAPDVPLSLTSSSATCRSPVIPRGSQDNSEAQVRLYSLSQLQHRAAQDTRSLPTQPQGARKASQRLRLSQGKGLFPFPMFLLLLPGPGVAGARCGVRFFVTFTVNSIVCGDTEPLGPTGVTQPLFPPRRGREPAP